MNKTFLLLLCGAFSLCLSAQPNKPKPNTTQQPPSANKNNKKYSSLLWEITGNGLKKPSYLFGTMHVSDKLAFHLGDSFYNALKRVQVVALETNPETWQDDYSKASFLGKRRGGFEGYMFGSMASMPDDRMSITSFAIDDYQEALKAALSVEPSMVNGLLYRTYGTQLDDFEEDTYLDMYIFQAGKKLGKRLTGVENFQESEKLVMEAYRDMYKDRNRKRRSMDFEDVYSNPKRVEDAYRKGDLDVLDSLQDLNTISEAFEEKFLYKRNEIQAHSIDTILKKNQSLFAAVGAAHLPGKRGIIEMLRQMGYTVRPVKMDERNSVQKEAIDRMHFPSKFANQTSDDGFYQVSIPGKKFYRFTDWYGMDVVQNADMVNGAYYMVTRIKTNGLFWGHSADLIHRRIDSFLYENVPGKILKKTPIAKNGYKGWDIQNRTRRGDYQRYNIFVTPFEIIFFKMSGNGDFVRTGTEAQQFFGSVKLKEYLPGEWTRFSPPTGGFSVQLPHPPSVIRDQYFGADRFEYSAFDAKGNSYLIMQSSLHNYSYAEEDTFELNLMGDSYGHSAFIEKELNRQFNKQNGYPAMDAKYRHKDGSFSTVRYIIRGPLYYVLAAHHKKEDENIKPFLQSFSIAPFVYPAVQLRSDTAMRFTVKSPVFHDTTKKEDEEFDEYTAFFRMAMEDEESEFYGIGDRYKSAVIGNDTVGEKIYVSYVAPPKYLFEKDSSKFWKTVLGSEINDDSSLIVKLDKQSILQDGSKIRDVHLTDTGSSRIIQMKIIYKNGHLFSLSTLTDTLSQPSVFLTNFFNTFAPADTLKGEQLFARKTERFFQDFFSADSATARKARRSMSEMKFDSLDVAHLKNAIDRINWKTKNYLGTKKYFIGHLGKIKEPSVVPFLKELYGKVKDTADLQKAVLNALLKQRTKESYIAFKDLILQEPPISDGSYDYDDINGSPFMRPSFVIRHDLEENDGPTHYGPWGELYDTLALTQTIFPDMLQLMGVEDYKEDVMNLLVTLVDSGYVKAPAYETHFSKLYLDAKQLLKKQMAGEERDNIEKLSKKDRSPSIFDYEDDEEKELDRGNNELEQYAVLLLPFYDKNPGVPVFFDQLLKSKDRQLLYNTFILLLRNNKPVPDSLFLKYAKVDEYRAKLYDDLQAIKKLDKFPAAYRTQEQMARSMLLKHRYYYSKPDTLVFLQKLPVTYKKQNGFVYFFKYKEERDDVTWKLASVGMQPEKQDSIDIKNREFTAMGERKLENDSPVDEQLEKMLRELLYEKRMSAAGFYDSRGRYNLYKTYLPDMVKSRRYRD